MFSSIFYAEFNGFLVPDSAFEPYSCIIPAFWEQVFTGGSDLGPEGADRRESLHGCQDTWKEYCYNKNLPKTVYLLYYYNLCKLDAYYHMKANFW